MPVVRHRCALIQSSIGAACALDMDAEQVSVLENLTGMIQRAERLGTAGTIHREHADGGEPPLLEPALDAFALEVLGLTHEVNHAWAGQRQQCVVDDGKMVGRNDGAALVRNMLKPLWRSAPSDGWRSVPGLSRKTSRAFFTILPADWPPLD